EQRFGVTIKQGLTVIDLADKGEPFPETEMAEWRELALSYEYPLHLAHVPDDEPWELPAGAYKRCSGPPWTLARRPGIQGGWYLGHHSGGRESLLTTLGPVTADCSAGPLFAQIVSRWRYGHVVLLAPVTGAGCVSHRCQRCPGGNHCRRRRWHHASSGATA